MSEGDMVAREAKYHIKCLNKLRKQNNESDISINSRINEIKSSIIQNVPVFKLSELKVKFNSIRTSMFIALD